MALKYSVTNNGNTWDSVTPLASIPLSNGAVTDTITSAGTRVLNCDGKVAANNIVIGAKELHCAGKKMAGKVTIIASSDGRFVAGGSSGKASHSSNGLSWTSITPLNSSQINGVTFGNGRFVYVGEDSKSGYSLNGTTWTAMSGLGGNNEYACGYGGGVFVSVGDGTYDYYSENGTSWTRFTSFSALYKYRAVAYGLGKFVVKPGTTRVGYYSSNGKTWTAMSGSSGGGYYNLCFGNSRFLGIDPDKQIGYSTNGTSWTGSTSVYAPIVPANKGIAYGNGRFVILEGHTAYYSTDNGNTWTAMTGLDSSKNYYSVEYGDGKFVAVGSGDSKICTDGTSWTGTFSGNLNACLDCVYGEI